MRTLPKAALRSACAIALALCACHTQGVERAQAPDITCRSDHVRNTGRALLCGQVIDRTTGLGVGGGLLGGNARFVRDDGVEMNGPVDSDGSFSLNVAGGRGTLTVDWSCRRGRQLTDTLTLPPGTGTALKFLVSAEASDTLCRVSTRESRADPSRDARDRWLRAGGCWSIRYQPWHPDIGPEYPVSTWIQLTSPDAGADGRQFRDSLDSRAPWRARLWQPLRGDSLEIVWSTGFAAVTLTLGASGDSLSGIGLWTFDVIRTDSLGFIDNSGLPTAAVSARQTACP